MRVRLAGAAGLLILLTPSAWFAWRERDLPQFGVNQDDSIYYVSAKSLAEGKGYRIASLPERPAQTKYPPLFPLYLALAWKIDPSFPGNLSVAALLGWLTIPALVALSLRLYRGWGFGGWRRWILVAMLAINPYVVDFGASLFSEMFFTCLLLVTLLLVEGEKRRTCAAAGLTAGLAYLARSAGLALILSGAAVLLWRKQARRAVIFAACAAPAVLGWSLWARLHQFPAPDEILLYYTNYFGYHLRNVSLADYPVMLWKNADGLLYGMGAMVIPEVTDALPVKILTEVVGIAMIAGVVRMARRGAGLHYAVFGALSALLMVIWHYPPNERFVLPLAPLLAAGFLTEMEHLWEMLRSGFAHRDRSERVVARGMAAACALVLAGALALQVYTLTVFMPAAADRERRINAEHRAAYQWISENLPREAGVIAYDDAVLYLYTGRFSMTLPIPTRYWYREDRAGMVAFYQRIGSFARAHHIGYVYFTSEDLGREMGDTDKRAVSKAVTENPELVPIHTTAIGTIYRVRRAPPG